jgi:hypothetical protein
MTVLGTFISLLGKPALNNKNCWKMCKRLSMLWKHNVRVVSKGFMFAALSSHQQWDPVSKSPCKNAQNKIEGASNFWCVFLIPATVISNFQHLEMNFMSVSRQNIFNSGDAGKTVVLSCMIAPNL